MRFRWLVLIPLVGLIVVVCSCMMVLLALVPISSTRQIHEAGTSQSTTTVRDPRQHEIPPQNMRELAEKIMEIANREQGQYRPIELVRIGEADYLILVVGTQLDSQGGNNPESAVQEMTRASSPYRRRVRALIEQHIPVGSRLHFAGHSLGGMIANTLATNSAFLEDYRVQTVTTFAEPVNACPNPDVVYRRYVVAGDPVPLLHWAAIWSRLKGPMEVLKTRCTGGYTYLEQTFIDHHPGPRGIKNPHSSYEYSQTLIGEPLPFTIERYESIGRFEPERQGRRVERIVAVRPRDD